MFTKLDKHASAHQARLLFLKIDDNGGGTVSLGELIPVVFNKASARQVRRDAMRLVCVRRVGARA